MTTEETSNTQELTPELIRAALTTVKYPGFSRDIVSFGLVKKIDIDEKNNVTDDALPYFLPLIQGEPIVKTENGLPKHFKLGNILD